MPHLLLCVVLTGCGRNDDAATRPPALTLPPGGLRLTVVQRSAAVVAGSGGRVRVHLGDITRGQVQLTLAGPDGATLIAPTSVKVGDALPFHLEGRYYVTVVQLKNRLVDDRAPLPDQGARRLGRRRARMAPQAFGDAGRLRSGRRCGTGAAPGAHRSFPARRL
ncbi:MAG: hypothetical protein ACYTG3_14260 [Planctomycetota bacterium]